MLSKADVLELVSDKLMPAFVKERERLDTIDKWLRWEHDPPHNPRGSSKEYKELSARAQTPWLALIVTSAAQNLYVDQYRSETDATNARPWEWWQANGLDARQIAVHRAALGYGHAYVTVIPGIDDFGAAMPVIRGHSPRKMMAFYPEPENDDWPMYALRVDQRRENWSVKLYDFEAVYTMQADSGGGIFGRGAWDAKTHNLGRCPVVRFANQLDLEGRTPGEVEPFIPLAGRIDQTTFDRLVVQRFASFVVRTVSGMTKPDTPEEEKAALLLMRVGDLLISEDTDTKFGALPGTPLEGFIKAAEADILALAATSQTPAHEMIGQMANLSAEALAAARASLTAKVEERKQVFGEPWEQTLRLAAHAMGDREAASDFGAQVRWRDTEIRSLAQAADALGKLAKMLGVPVELLWEKVPGFTQQDVARAKEIVEDGDSITQLVSLLERQAADTGAA